MIAMPAVYSTAPPQLLLLLGLLSLVGCGIGLPPPTPKLPQTEAAFTMRDGTQLPFRAWLPEDRDPVKEPPWAVILALHGMNDSRDAWEIPAPAFTDAGMAVFAPDQRGFGGTATRGLWAGATRLAEDATAMARILRARYPRAKLILMGESMGAAVLMLAATSATPPPADGYVLIAPAVWDRAHMNPFNRVALWLASRLFPEFAVSNATAGRIAGRLASDNRDALNALSRNPLTIKNTRFGAIRGLVDLMDAAAAAASRFDAPALVPYGGNDELIPADAMQAAWAALPPGPRRALYPGGYHLLLRDLGRAAPIADIIAWARRPDIGLPAEAAAAGFLVQKH